MMLHPGSLTLTFARASLISEHDVVFQEVEQLLLCEGNALTVDLPRALTAFCRVNTACSIAADARKMDMTLMLGGHCFTSATRFRVIVTQ